jgi:ubiquinone/menaquinone biosynthesis C-methylase UbiE
VPELYSMENAIEFNWSSLSNDLNPERQALLDKYLTGNKILDAGCGGGSYVSYLAKNGFDCLGIDKFQDFVNFANKNNDLDGKVFQGDVTSLPFQDKTFDTAFCFDVLEHVDDYASLSELERVTSKRIIIAVPKIDTFFKKYNLTFLHYQDKSHLRTYDEDMLQNLINSVNYKSSIVLDELAVPQKTMINEMLNTCFQGNPGRFSQYVLSKSIGYIAAKVKFKPIYTGLVAVIDLT